MNHVVRPASPMAADDTSPTPSDSTRDQPVARPARHHYHSAGELVHDVTAQARRSWRKWRWLVRIVVGTPVIIALLVLILMQSPLVGWMAKRQMGRLTGCRVESGRSWVGLDGALVMNEPQFYAPGVAGEAGVLMRADTAEFVLDWSGVLTGHVECTHIRLKRPEFRVSQSKVDGRLNFGAMAGAMPRGVSGVRPPAVDAWEGSVVFAEHDAAGRMETLRTIRVDGSFVPTRTDKPVYALKMYELAQSFQGPARGMVLSGRVDIDAAELELRLLYLPLESWRPESVPSAYRDLWRRLNVQGEVKQALLAYKPADGLTIEMTVSDVSMNALIPAEETFAGPARDLVLRNMNGTIRLARAGLRADLTGALPGQRGLSRVVLTTDGLALDAALACRIAGESMTLSKDPEFLPYVPLTAREYLGYFSGPTAEINADVLIARGPPENGRPAEFRVQGRLHFRKGTAAFHRFPYPFHDMEGLADFDENTIRIVNITGRGPTGARLRAHGTISPLTDDAGVDVLVRVTDAPLDEHLIGAMPENRRRVVEAIFHGPSHQALLDKGLIRRPNQASADGTRAAPPFAFGGVADIDVRVRRTEGSGSDWATDVDVRFARAGLVAEPFPLPVVAHNLHVHVGDESAQVVSGEFAGLSGGRAELRGGVSFFDGDRPVTRPELHISAYGLPIDALLINALPEKPLGDAVASAEVGAGGAGGAREWSARRLIEELGITGTIEAGVTITGEPSEDAPDDPRIEYDASVSLTGLRASPLYHGAPGALGIEDLSGVMRISRDRLLVSDARGRLVRQRDQAEPESAIGSFDLDALVPLGARASGYNATVSVEDLRLQGPFEPLLAVFSADAEHLIQELRESHEPEGMIGADVTIARRAGHDGSDVRVRLNQTRDLSIAALGGRLAMNLEDGRVSIDLPAGEDVRAEAQEARVRLWMDGQEAGDVMLNGLVGIEPSSGVPTAPAHLEARLDGWRFESPLLPPLVKRLGDESVEKEYLELAPSGLFGAAIRIAGDASGRVLLTGHVKPESIGFSRRGERVEIPTVSGRISFESDPEDTGATRGTVDGVVLTMPAPDGWRGWVDGEWAVAGEPGSRVVYLDTMLGIDAPRVDERLTMLAPEKVWAALQALEVRIDGPLELSGGRLQATLGGEPTSAGGVPPDTQESPARVSFAGRIEARDLSLDVGVPVLAPLVSVEVDWPDETGDRARQAHADLHLPAASIAAIGVEDALVRVVRGGSVGPDEAGAPAPIAIPVIEATCHGGRIVADAQIAPGRSGDPDSPSAYEVNVVAAGIRFAPLLAELERGGAAEGFVGPLPDERLDPDLSRGQLDARLWLSGVSGDARSRMGEGAIRIAHGQVIRLPVVFPLLQVSNLVLPSNDRFDQLETTFRVVGPRAIFDEILVQSHSISLVGEGSITFPELTLDMHFNSRANRRIPLVSGLFEALRDEIVTTTIGGTLAEPDISTEALHGTRKVIHAIVHGKDKARAEGAEIEPGRGSMD